MQLKRIRDGSASVHRIVWCVTATIAVLLVGDVVLAEPEAVPPRPLQKLNYQDRLAAGKARDNADLMRADMERRMQALGLLRAGAMQRHKAEGKPPSPEVVEIESKATDVAKAYQEVIDTYPQTEIAAYCAMRLSGLHGVLGDHDKAIELLKQTAEEFAGTEQADKLAFEIGLMYAQAKHDHEKASVWFARVPMPTNAGNPREIKYYLSAQQQLVKCELNLNLDQQANERVDAFKTAFPKLAAEMDRFHTFEVQARNSQPATGAAKQPVQGHKEAAPQKAKAPAGADQAAKRDDQPVKRDGSDRTGAVMLRVESAIESLRSQIPKSQDYGFVHRSILALKVADTAGSRALLHDIALGDVKVENPNLQRWAANNLIACDRSAAWTLLTATDSDVLTTALNAAVKLPLDEERMPSLKKCLQNKHDLVRWCAANVLATAPEGKLATEAVEAIAQAVAAVADMPDINKPDPNNRHVCGASLVHTIGEENYHRFFNVLVVIHVDDRALRELAARQKGRARDTVIVALAQRGDKSVRESIITLARDPDAGLFRAWAVYGLEKIGTADDLALLQTMAKSDPLVREGPLRPLHDRDPEDQWGPMFPVREAAEVAISVLKKKLKE